MADKSTTIVNLLREWLAEWIYSGSSAWFTTVRAWFGDKLSTKTLSSLIPLVVINKPRRRRSSEQNVNGTPSYDYFIDLHIVDKIQAAGDITEDDPGKYWLNVVDEIADDLSNEWKQLQGSSTYGYFLQVDEIIPEGWKIVFEGEAPSTNYCAAVISLSITRTVEP